MKEDILITRKIENDEKSDYVLVGNTSEDTFANHTILPGPDFSAADQYPLLAIGILYLV